MLDPKGTSLSHISPPKAGGLLWKKGRKESKVVDGQKETVFPPQKGISACELTAVWAM